MPLASLQRVTYIRLQGSSPEHAPQEVNPRSLDDKRTCFASAAGHLISPGISGVWVGRLQVTNMAFKLRSRIFITQGISPNHCWHRDQGREFQINFSVVMFAVAIATHFLANILTLQHCFKSYS